MYISQSDSVIEILAPAKLNLFLEVLGRRDDGFHEIETLMATISLFDTLRFAALDRDEIRLTCRWAEGINATNKAVHENLLSDLPEAGDNIVFRVLKELKRRTGEARGAHVELVKRIPSEAGLGGGSSDAAAALVAANLAWDLRWPREQLAEFAAEFGSDIPFFFHSGAAICRGRGERIERIDRFPRLSFVVARPVGGLSTKEVYRRCQPAASPQRVDGLVSSLREQRLDRIGRQFANRLQAPAEELSPHVADLRRTFEQLDCLGHQMSGSGTSYFGLCRNGRHARRVAGRLRAAGIRLVFHVSTIAAAAQRL